MNFQQLLEQEHQKLDKDKSFVKVYYPLTEKDIERGYINYSSSQYDNKLLHTSLNKLKSFLKEEFGSLEMFPYYTIVYFDYSQVDDSVLDDEEGTVSIKLPFYIDLKDKKLKRLI